MTKIKSFQEILNNFKDNTIYCYFCLTYFKESQIIIYDNDKCCPYCLSSKLEIKERLKRILG